MLPSTTARYAANDCRAGASPADILALASGALGEDFRRHVENDFMKRTPHPDTKPMGTFTLGLRPK